MSFEDFWQAYPVKKGKKRARQLFEKLSPADQAAAVAGVARYQETRQWQDLRYIPHPSTFLSQARWQDELHPEEISFSREEVTLLKHWRRAVGPHAQCLHDPVCPDQETCDRKRVNIWRLEGRL